MTVIDPEPEVMQTEESCIQVMYHWRQSGKEREAGCRLPCVVTAFMGMWQ